MISDVDEALRQLILDSLTVSRQNVIDSRQFDGFTSERGYQI